MTYQGQKALPAATPLHPKMAIIANAKMLLDDPDAIWSYVILCDTM